MATFRGFLKSRVRHLFSALLVVLGVITIVPAFTGSVTAHHAEATAEVSCEGIISWTATAWEGYPNDEPSRTNANVRVWVEILAGTGVAPADQFGAFNSGNGFSFSGTFTWPAGATIVNLKVEALAIWGNGNVPGSGPWPVYLELPTDCGSTPEVTVNPSCDNQTYGGGDGKVVVSFTNTGGPFAGSVTFDVAAFGGQPATTVTVAVGATETLTYTGLPDGNYTIPISLDGQEFSRNFIIDCDQAMPGASAVGSCDAKSDGQILLTLTNSGGESVTFTVVGPDAVSRDFTVAAGGPPATYTYLDLADGVYVITIAASDGTTGLDQTVTVDCDQAVPSAFAVCNCEFNGDIKITLVNSGNEAVTFTVTDPRDSTTHDVVVAAASQEVFTLSGFDDGVVVIPIVANGVALDVTVTVDCDPVFDIQAICTDVTGENLYWYAIRNTEAVDLVVSWDGGTVNVPAGATRQIASTVAPLSLKFNGIEIATADAESEICKQTTIFEKKLVGQPETGETYSIRVSRLDDSTFFTDLTFDINAGEVKSIDLPSTLGDDGIEYLIEELNPGTASKSSVFVDGAAGSIVTTAGHLNETISVVVVNGYAAVQIDKQLLTTNVVAGGQLTYTLKAQNTGALTLDPVVITDLLPPETAFVSAAIQDNGGSCVLAETTRPQLLRCTMDDALPVAGFTKTITMVVVLDAGVASGTKIINQSMVQGNFEDAALSIAGDGRIVHSPLPAALLQLTCPGLPGEVCDLSGEVAITVGHSCNSTTTTAGGCGGTTTTTTGCGSTTTTVGGCGATTTTAAKPTTTTGGTLPRTGGEPKSQMSIALGLGCIGGAMMLSRPRLPRRWRVAR